MPDASLAPSRATADVAQQAMSDPALDVLEFRMVPKTAASPRRPEPIAPKEVARYKKDLSDNGPAASMEGDDKFVWMEVKPSVKLPEDLVTAQYRRAKHLLVHNTPPYVVRPEESGFWYIDERATGGGGRPHVGFQAYPSGPDPLYYLTSTNTGEELAAIIESKVVTVQTISAAVGSQAVLSGNFTRGRKDELMEVLRTEVLPAARAAYAARAAAAKAYALPTRSMRVYLVPILIFLLLVSGMGFLVYR